jgi:maleylpyruvate isomerase
MSVPRDDLAGLAAANHRLLADLGALTDTDMGAASRLPDWTVGHVLTHLARSADGLTRMAMAATRGEVGHQYPGGADQRSRDIEAGARRTAHDQVEDLRRSIEDLDAAFGRLDADAWRDGIGVATHGERRIAELPFRRWREVEVHHADLGRAAFTYDDWSEAYVERELNETLGGLAGRVPAGVALRIEFEDVPHVEVVGDGDAVTVSGTRRWVLAWLIGRIDAPDLPELGPWP